MATLIVIGICVFIFFSVKYLERTIIKAAHRQRIEQLERDRILYEAHLRRAEAVREAHDDRLRRMAEARRLHDEMMKLLYEHQLREQQRQNQQYQQHRQQYSYQRTTTYASLTAIEEARKLLAAYGGYRAAVKKTHPDLGGNALEFRRVQAAKELLDKFDKLS